MSGINGYYTGEGEQKWIPVRVDGEGRLLISAADIAIGAVEIKDALVDNRATVAADGRLAVDGNLQVGDANVAAGNPVPTSVVVALPAGANTIGSVDEAAVACAVADVDTPLANVAAVVTYGAAAGLQHVITGIAWSYIGGMPTGGRLTITDAAAVVFDIDITEDGPGYYVFPKPKMSAAQNTAMVVTLAAGGAGITGKLSIVNHYTV